MHRMRSLIFKSLDDEWKVQSKEVPSSNRSRLLQPIMEELDEASDLVAAGTQHALLMLEIAKGNGSNRRLISFHSREQMDVERAEDDCVPGGVGFAFHLQKEIKEITSRQRERHITSGTFPIGVPGSFDSSEDFLRIPLHSTSPSVFAAGYPRAGQVHIYQSC